MGIKIPLRKKVTLIPSSMDERDPHELPTNNLWFPFYFIFMMPSFTITISKAIRRNNHPFAVLYASVYVGFFLSRLCLSKFISVPKHEKLIQQFWIKLDIWFFYSAVTFGFVYQFAAFNPLQTTVALYIVVSACSSILLFVFVIVDLVTFWRIWRYGEDETRLSENQNIDDGKLNYYSVSICEKV